MAGRGPAPKDPAKRARRNADPTPTTTLRPKATKPPALPAKFPILTLAGARQVAFPPATKKWWETWKASPQAETFTATDWSFLLDTAILHARLWQGDGSVAAELRIRVAKFGATVEDRARLRMTFAQADEAEGKKPTPTGARQRYGDLKVLPGGAAKKSG